MSNLPVSPQPSNPAKIINLQNLIEQPQSLKLLILHTPYKLQISTLWKCTNLIKLDLSKNNLFYFPFIGNLYNLKFMFLHQNKLNFQQLKGIFYSQDQPTYSPLSKSILWVTYYGNKNPFIARHFLTNETSCIAVDSYMVVPQQRKTSIILYHTEPFNQITSIQQILQKQTNLNKNATQQEYMQQFWQQMKILRKKTQQIMPIIKIQKVFKGWILRKKIKDKKNQIIGSIQLKSITFKAWKLSNKRNNKLLQILTLKHKQHLLLPLKQMKIQHIKRKLLQWTARAKKRVLLRKLSLASQVRFFGILRSNTLMFKSLYDCLQIEKSNFVMIDAQSFKIKQHILRRLVKQFHGDETFTVKKNMNYMIRQSVEGNIKKQFPRIMSLNQRSYIIRLFHNYDKLSKKNHQKPKKSLIKPINKSICSLPPNLTNLKGLYNGLHKIHLNRKQYVHSNQIIEKLNINQRLILNQYILLQSSNKRLLKDLIRCVYFINIGVFDNMQNNSNDNENHNANNANNQNKQNNYQITININNNRTNNRQYTKKVQIFSQKSLNNLSAVTYLQNFWRGYIARKNQRKIIYKFIIQRRSIVKIQRWLRKLKYIKKQKFKKQLMHLYKNITDRHFYVEMNQYLKAIENSQIVHNNRVKFLEQYICPYIDFSSKKIGLDWNLEDNSLRQIDRDNLQICSVVNKLPFDMMFLENIFKSKTNIKEFFNVNRNNLMNNLNSSSNNINANNLNSLTLSGTKNLTTSTQQYEKAQLSHLFHFNTWISLLSRQKKSFIKVSSRSVQQTKLRILGILLQNYQFLNGFSIKIYPNQYFDHINSNNIKNIVNKQSIFITKSNILLKQNNQKIQKFIFKAKIYLNQENAIYNNNNSNNNNNNNSNNNNNNINININNIKPKKIQDNLLIFIPVFMITQSEHIININRNNISKQNNNMNINNNNNNNNPKARIKKSISLLQKPTLSIQDLQLSQQHSKFNENPRQIKLPSHNHPRSINISNKQIKPRNYSTIHDSQSNYLKQVKKQDLLPYALKKILPLKKQIKSYKIQKRIKPKENIQMFILDNVSKNQRIKTQPKEIYQTNHNNINNIINNSNNKIELHSQQQLSLLQIQKLPSSSSHLKKYSSVRQKIRQQYLTRKQNIKNQRSQSSFYQNFTNVNNFIQQQQLYQKARRIKTQQQIHSYQSVNSIKQQINKAHHNARKQKQLKLIQIQKSSKQDKHKIQNMRKQIQKQKNQIQRNKSIQRKKQHNKNQPKRLKVSFAQECFPIISRSYNNQSMLGDENKDKIKKWTHINTQYNVE